MDPSAAHDANAPIPVEVRQPNGGPLATLISPLLGPLATAGIIIVFIIFILYSLCGPPAEKPRAEPAAAARGLGAASSFLQAAVAIIAEAMGGAVVAADEPVPA